jgi:hypothetical protein
MKVNFLNKIKRRLSLIRSYFVIYLVITQFYLIGMVACNNLSIPHSPVHRFATYNTSLFRNEAGGLIRDLSDSANPQARNVAAIIQLTCPDVIALLEFDYDPDGLALALFRQNYLAVGQEGMEPMHYEYGIAFPSNTGDPTLLDLNRDGQAMGPEDAFGYGRFLGQYAFAILSKYPIDTSHIRTFKNFLWKDMPNPSWPVLPGDKKSYYTEEEKAILRLSSKNHVDISILLPEGDIHLLVAHPTPPTFDGDEDRNGRRNYDEILFFADYITPGKASAYIYDDRHHMGGLDGKARFVIMGDLNADPVDGDSFNHAIQLLLTHPRINHRAVTGKLVPASKGSAENATRNPRKTSDNLGNQWHDTSIWGLRVDYILPSTDIKVINSGIFWPETSDSLYYLVKDNAASDHFLVWMDIKIREQKVKSAD